MGATRWLDDEEQQTWRAFLAASQLVREALDRQLQRDAGMPHTYFVLMATLSEADHRTLTMTELARRTRSSPSRLSHAVAKLETKGWVRRGRHRGDHRTTLATLTDRGFTELEATAPGHAEESRLALFDHLSREQVGQLGHICRAVMAGAASREAQGECREGREEGRSGERPEKKPSDEAEGECGQGCGG